MNKLLLNLPILTLLFPIFSFAQEDCSIYSSQITKARADIVDYKYEYVRLADLTASEVKKFKTSYHGGISGYTMNLRLLAITNSGIEAQNSVLVKISYKEVEIEKLNLSYSACVQGNYSQVIQDSTTKLSTDEKVKEEITKLKAYDEYYAQKAKDDTIKLQKQIEEDKKNREKQAIIDKKKEKAEQNKKRLQEIRNKAKLKKSIKLVDTKK